jgi:hypothetical protein
MWSWKVAGAKGTNGIATIQIQVFKDLQEQPVCITEMTVTASTTSEMIRQLAEATCLAVKNEEIAALLAKENERLASELAQSFLGQNGTYL